MAGLLLQWRPRRFVESVARSVSSVGGVLVQFPFLGAIAAIMTSAANSQGQTLSGTLGYAFAHLANHSTYAIVVLAVNFPIVLVLLWLLGTTLDYRPPLLFSGVP